MVRTGKIHRGEKALGSDILEHTRGRGQKQELGERKRRSEIKRRREEEKETVVGREFSIKYRQREQ